MSEPPQPPASLRAMPPPPLLRRTDATRPMSTENLNSMRTLLEDDKTAAAAINVMQELGLTSVVEQLQSKYPNLSSELDAADRTRVLSLVGTQGGFRRRSQTARFNRCVKGVRKTVTPRAKSTKESAAIAICTKTILQRKGRTLKKYRKGKRLMTQKLKRKD